MGLGGSKLVPCKGMVVLITGCSEGGIGHALAVEFAARGCTVVATARSTASMKSLQEQWSNISCVAMDVLQENSTSQAVEETIQKHGKIDVLVNNAGVPCLGPVAEIPMETLERAFRTNVFGAISLAQKVVPHMVAQGSGRIVNVGSIAGFASGPWMAGYTASKAAVHALTDSMRVELKPFNINVILVTPGAITSNIGKNALLSKEAAALKLYKPFEESINYRGMLSQSPKSTPAAEFARKVIDKILLRKPPAYIACGHLVPVMSTLYYAPAWVRDFFFVKLLKIDRVRVPAICNTSS